MDYTNINQLWFSALFDIDLSGCHLESRAGSCKEVLGFRTVLTHPMNNILLVPKRKFSLSYACAEMLWYLSGQNNIELIQAYAPQYKKFAENDVAYGAYGHRWANNPGFKNERQQFTNDVVMSGDAATADTTMFRDQLTSLIYLLRTNPNTRQAVMTMWDSGDLVHAILGIHKDLPCTLSLCFFVRNRKLHLIATMRSNDAWLGLPYDVFCFTTLQQIIASELNLELGIYVHQVGSEHIYEKNQEKINEITDSSRNLPYPHLVKRTPKDAFHSLDWNIEQALLQEKNVREKGVCDFLMLSKLDPIFKDLVLGCGTNWMLIQNSWFSNHLYSLCQEFYKNE